MLMRNLIELAVLIAVLVIGLGVYLYVKKKASYYESNLAIRQKDKIPGKLQ